MMAECVDSARSAGVFKEFHVFADRPIDGCECYDAQTIEKTGGLFKLVYLKAGMSKLLFDYFVWIDADSRFMRNPNRVLDALGRSPIHAPLIENLSEQKEDRMLDGISSHRYVELMRRAGVLTPVYSCSTAFWIVKREAIDHVCQLANDFLEASRTEGMVLDANAAIGYAMQMLCANPQAHLQESRPDLWASDDRRAFQNRSEAESFHREGLHRAACVTPAILHLHHCDARLGKHGPAVA